MKLSFQQQLNVALLRSERTRTLIIIGIFSFAAGYRLLNTLLFKTDEETRIIQSLSSVWLFPLFVILFELFSLLYINRCIRKEGQRIPLLMQYLNVAFEICMPALIMFGVAKQYPSYDVMKSPALYIYFIFIILSTLRLNFILSFFCGLLASTSYIFISYFMYHHFNSNDSGKALIILLSGVAAGLVANQIKSSINNTLKETEKRRKVESLFGQQISSEIASKMLESDGNIESKRMNVAVMFIDIRNFTDFASSRNPEEIVQFQNAFFKIVIDTVSVHKGIVHQFLGDGCMVTFGAPLVLDNPSEMAVKAAQGLLLQLDAAIINSTIPSMRIGIGIHTGEAVTGNIGTADRQQYSVTGRVVIMASRIEQLNKKLESRVLISGEVVASIDKTSVNVELYGPVCLKGFDQPVSIYKLA